MAETTPKNDKKSAESLDQNKNLPHKIPQGIQQKIEELKTLETELGHLPPETWAVNKLQKRVDPDFPFQAAQMEQQTELLFGDICDDLSEIGLQPQQIADVVNATVNYPGGPKYCNVTEVRESLGLTE
jgi:hypothetical protein